MLSYSDSGIKKWIVGHEAITPAESGICASINVSIGKTENAGFAISHGIIIREVNQDSGGGLNRVRSGDMKVMLVAE